VSPEIKVIANVGVISLRRSRGRVRPWYRHMDIGIQVYFRPPSREAHFRSISLDRIEP